jgi:hypothetical protein
VTGKTTCVKDQGENQNSCKENHCPFEGSVHRSFAAQLNNPEAKKSRCYIAGEPFSPAFPTLSRFRSSRLREDPQDKIPEQNNHQQQQQRKEITAT